MNSDFCRTPYRLEATGRGFHRLTSPVVWLFLFISSIYLRLDAGTVDVIQNGNFESGSAWWHTNTLAGKNATDILAGSYPNTNVSATSLQYAYVGDRSSTNSNSIGSCFQVFTVPNNATIATLTFWLNVYTTEAGSTQKDKMDVALRTYSPDTLIYTLLSFSNLSAADNNNTHGVYRRQTATYDLRSYRGQAILLQFYAITTASNWTIFRIDDVNLAVETEDAAPNLVPYTPPGWSDSIVVSKARGDLSGSEKLFSTDDLYLNWAIKNNGQAPTTVDCYTGVTIDVTWWQSSWRISSGLGTGQSAYLVDVPIPRLSIGVHDVTLANDITKVIPTEHDGTYTKKVVIYPASPSELQCSVNGAAIHLTWKINVPEATGGRITRKRTDTGVEVSFGVDAGATEFDDKSIVRGVEYCYTVAVAANGYVSLESNPCCAKVPNGDPPGASISGQPVAAPGVIAHFRNAGSRGSGYQFAWLTDDGQSATSVDADFVFHVTGRRRVDLRVSAPGTGYADATATAYIDIQPQVVGSGSGGSSGNFPVSNGADPVNLASGNYIYSHTDLKLPGIGMPFEFTRYYNSRAGDQAPGPFGYGWTFTPFVTVMEAGTNAVVTYGDGHSETHTLTDAGYVGGAGVFDRLAKQDDLSWLVITKSQTTNVVDSSGRLQRVVDRNGNSIELEYEAGSGRLTAVIDTAKRRTTFLPHGDHPSLIGAIEDISGRRIVFDYDTQSNLVSVTDAQLHSTRFAYNEQHQMTDAWDNRDNLIVHNDYDANLNVVFHQYDGYTNHVYFSFDFTNRVTMQTNALGGVSIYKFDSNLLLTNVTDEAGRDQVFGFDDKRNRVYVRDRNGNETKYAYDDRGNVTKKTDALTNVTTIEYDSRNNPTRRTDALGNQSTFAYDDRGNLLSTTNALGLTTTVQYDEKGLPLVVTDARGISTTNQFDSQGNLLAVIDTRGNTNRFVYDEIGRKSLQIDALGRTNIFTYDANNNLLLSVNALGFTNTFGYDANNNRVSVQDPRGATTLSTFDLKDRVVSVRDATNHTVSNVYDALDRKVSTVDARSNATGYAYDPIGNLVAVTNALFQVTQFTYDKNQNQVSLTDPAGSTTAKTYDALNRLILTVDPLTHTNATGYDAVGRVVSTTDANGQVTTFNFDAIGRLTNVIDAAQQPVFFVYDENGNRIKTTDPNGHTSTNVFDDLNRLVEQWDPLGHKTVLRYDTVGNLTNKVTPNGHSIVYSYDALNRLTNIAYPDASSVAFAYDCVGNRTNMVDWSGQTTWEYDLLNRIVAVTDS